MRPDVIILATVLGGGMLLLLLSLYLRFKRHQFRHKERMAALEKGASLPVDPPEATPGARVYLLRGMMWLFAGIGLTLFLFRLAYVEREPRMPAAVLQERLLWEKRLKELGADEEQVKQVRAQSRSHSRPFIPEPFALIGLIPIGVGLSYLIFHAAESRRRDG